MEGHPPAGGPAGPPMGLSEPYEGQRMQGDPYQTQPQQGYPPQQGYGSPRGAYRVQQQGGGGSGMGDRAAEVAQTVGRHIRTPETKPFYATSEFLVWLLTAVGLLIAGAVIDNGDHGDVLRANTVWLLITILSFAYIISRGISKSGTRYRNDNRGNGDGYGGY